MRQAIRTTLIVFALIVLALLIDVRPAIAQIQVSKVHALGIQALNWRVFKSNPLLTNLSDSHKYPEIQGLSNGLARFSDPLVSFRAQIQENTPTLIPPVATSTPNEDGIIIHTVRYGETLYDIAQAYGVPIDQILRNSDLSPTTTNIREGQELLIQTAQEPSPTFTPTPTEDIGTPTPTEPRPTMTPFPTRTPAPTFTPTPPPSIVHRALGEGTFVGIVLILVCGIGLILVIYRGFLKNP